MWREVLTHNSSVLVLNVNISVESVIAHLTVFVYEPKLNSFVVISQKKQAINSLETRNGSSKISVLGCKVVLDQHCGIFLPYLVVQSDKHCYLFYLDSNNEWILKYKFAVPEVSGKHVLLCDISYSIENGPTLIWTVSDKMFIYKAEYSLDTDVDCILRIPYDLTHDKRLQVDSNILWWNSSEYPNISERGMIVVKQNKAKILNSYLITIDNKKRETHISKVNTPIIPSLYLAITLCTLVIPEHLPSFEDGQNDISYRVFISTTQNQVLEFYNGKYVKHMNIPLSSCQNIEMFESPKGDVILLCCQDDQICAVDWMSSVILKTYHISFKLLIDDFIGLGTSQVLLFNGVKYEDEQILDNFMLNDFCKVDVVKYKDSKEDEGLSSLGITDVKSRSIESCSIDNVVTALRRKVQVTEMSIIQCKIEKSEKSSFVNLHCENLSNMLMNEAAWTSTQNSGLAQLVIGQEADHQDLRIQNSKITVKSKWQETTGSEWIIGLEVENVGPRTVSDISFCAVNRTSRTLRSSSKIQLSKVHGRNQEEQVLPTGHIATIVGVTPLPSFLSQSHFTVGLMLTWKQYESDEYFSQFCGNVTLRVDDVIKVGKRNCQPHALQPFKTQVMLSVGDRDIISVVELLKSNMDICETYSSFKSYHFRSPTLIATHLNWTCENNTLVINIFTRDKNQLCLCLRLLRQQLPDNLTWQPSGKKLVLGFAITTLKNEIALRISGLSILLRSQTTMRSSSSENSVIVTELDEISVKRRKISEYKDNLCGNSNHTFDLNMCGKTFLDICSCFCGTENAFLTFFILHN